VSYEEVRLDFFAFVDTGLSTKLRCEKSSSHLRVSRLCRRGIPPHFLTGNNPSCRVIHRLRRKPARNCSSEERKSVMHGMYQILVVLLFIGMIAAPVVLAAKAGRGASEDEA
jgi:hypothetical protein